MTRAEPVLKWRSVIYKFNGLEDQHTAEIYRLATQTVFTLLYSRNTLRESHCLAIRRRLGHYYTADMLYWYDDSLRDVL